MSRLSIVPQHVSVAAPIDLIFQIISMVDYDAMPGSVLSISRVATTGGRVLAEFTSHDEQTHVQIVKEVLADPPDRLAYRHLAGPYIGATEEIHLQPVENGIEVLLSAEIPIAQESVVRLLRHFFEESARAHLSLVKFTAESRAHRKGGAGILVPIPMMTTEEEILVAAEQQEQLEWGHVGHGRGVARMAVGLAQAMRLPSRHLEDLWRAALLHDLGKVAIASSLWGTLGALTEDQRTLMEAHVRLGYQLAVRAHLPEPVLASILHHHERWDGRGYPDHISEDVIPLKARILSLAEQVDAMMRASYRREPLSPDKMIDMLEKGAGRQWDPLLTRHMIRLLSGR